ncbi:Smr/MutS family protein [Polynucleobacter sp. 15G-AUS-farblos]|uniref:Smr/MutS family protein n=1 Tax=Polynucleobacter sp. 15G-AUS-farblos TaxID=2689094 RepID=UPI001C0E8580|nr:Smr/MutS family protein [Polynucleobacter sp. 15G-AUS-farblos]MBU3582439.1 Smr/MutS family protein [Polynucleobacter sp. 15G-AUS-farblos]
MTQVAECPECGNPRPLFEQCPYCSSQESPTLALDTIEINLKQGQPLVEEAIESLGNYLRNASELGIKAIVLIHGYGSSGEGGNIKRAVHHALESNYFSDRVHEYYFGETVPYGSHAYHALIKKRPGLKAYLKRFKAGNSGITVLLLNAPGVYA